MDRRLTYLGIPGVWKGLLSLPYPITCGREEREIRALCEHYPEVAGPVKWPETVRNCVRRAVEKVPISLHISVRIR
jgi:hypothetical protein